MVFDNREQAGRLLAERLRSLAPFTNPIVFALPRGGLPIGYEISKRLKAPLEIVVVRKIGAPINPEFGIGAIAEDGYYWIDADSAHAVRATSDEILRTAKEEFAEVNRRVEQYREGRPLPELQGRTAIVVDDGLATGVTARVACHFLKNKGAERVILAVPVCSPRTSEALRPEVDEVLCLSEPADFRSVGQFYQDFEQLTDEDVMNYLSRRPATLRREEVIVRERSVSLPGIVTVPPTPKGIVLFAHGSGSSRRSPRNLQVAEALVDAGFATLLFDLLTEQESEDRENVFDIPLLGSRLALATRWVRRQDFGRDLRLGYFGASTGAAAALTAAGEPGQQISAVVSRGGRPDLAIPVLPLVTAPTLLLVGGYDEPVIEMNKEALKHLRHGSLVIIPGATHLFEEPGTLERVTSEAILWFRKHLAREAPGAAA